MLRIGLLLAGCGYLDGTDPVQAIALRVAVARGGHVLLPLAPNVDQADTLDALGQALPARKAAVEAARLAGGTCEAVERVDPADLDALLVPGGLGVVKTLCDAGVHAEVTVESGTAALLRGVARSGGTIGCLDEGVVLTAWALDPYAPVALATGEDEVLRSSVESARQNAVVQSEFPVIHERPRVVSIQGAGSNDPARNWQLCAALWEEVERGMRNG